MKYYKLTDKDMQTYNNCQWVLGEKKTTSGNGGLCSDGWLHCYNDPTLAVLLNPVHADFDTPRLFEIEVGGEMKEDNGLKFGFTEMTLTKELPLPEVTLTHRVAFGILCTKEVCDDIAWNEWADNWLDGKDRSAREAARAARAAEAAWAASLAAVETAAWAAAWAAARAAEAAAEAAEAARAAAAAANNTNIDLIKIAKKAMGY